MRNDEALLAHGKDIERLAHGLRNAREAQYYRADRIDKLADEVNELATRLNADVPGAEGDARERPQPATLPSDLLVAAGALDQETLSKLDREFLHSVPAVPAMDSLDRFIVVTVGCMAALADFLLVGLPPKTRWTPGSEGGVVPEGWLSARLKSWNVRDDNWLADLCHVPFDRSTLPGTDVGFSGWNHRVLSLGHDPSPLGFVFGLMDIVSGRLTGIAYDGRPFSVEGVPASWTTVCVAPLLWLGHLISDVATPMGLPVPGSNLFQMLHIPVPGAPDGKTLADVTRILYLRGYDLRHYLAGGVVPGLVEGIIRLYGWLRYSDEGSSIPEDPLHLRAAEDSVRRAQTDARLASLLFWSHAVATGANAGRIALQGHTGDFFSAARSINLVQWQVFTLRTMQYVQARLRDTDPDQVVTNRERIDSRWAEFAAGIGTAGLFYDSGDSGYERIGQEGSPMSSDEEQQRLDAMIKQYLRLGPEVDLSDDTEIASLNTAEWRVIDLAIAVESEFGVDMSADKAIALRTVGDWRELIRTRQ